MIADPWVNHMPRNPLSPVQRAEQNIQYLEREVARLARELAGKEQELRVAHERLQKLLAG